jgi:hypothetical protein
LSTSPVPESTDQPNGPNSTSTGVGVLTSVLNLSLPPPLLAILILWIGLVRAGLSPKARTTGLLVTGLLLVWWVASDLVGRSGTQHWDVMRPVGWMIAILWLIPLMRWQRSVLRSMRCRCGYSRSCRSIARVAAHLLRAADHVTPISMIEPLIQHRPIRSVIEFPIGKRRPGEGHSDTFAKPMSDETVEIGGSDVQHQERSSRTQRIRTGASISVVVASA